MIRHEHGFVLIGLCGFMNTVTFLSFSMASNSCELTALHCHSGVLCDEMHVLLECPALDDLRFQFAPLIAESS